MSSESRGERSAKKRAAGTPEEDNAKKAKGDNCDLEWAIVNIDLPHGYRKIRNSVVKPEEELIASSYGYINNSNPVGIHLTLLDDFNHIRIFDCKDEHNIKTWKHRLEECYDSCFLHNDLQSAILIRQYDGQERRGRNDIAIDEVKNFVSSENKIQCNTLFQYNIPKNTKQILYSISRYRKSDNLLIVAMKRAKVTSTHLMIVMLNLSSKKQKVWHDPDVIEDILYFDEHYIVAVVVGKEGKIIKSMKLGDVKTPIKVIGKYKMKSWSAVYRIYLPTDSSASKICVDSCALKEKEDNLIKRWGKIDAKRIHEHGREILFERTYKNKKIKNMFVLDKYERMTIIGEDKIVMAGLLDAFIYLKGLSELLIDEYGFADQAVRADHRGEYNIDLYDRSDMKSFKHRLCIKFQNNAFKIRKVYWNSEWSSFIGTNDIGNLCCIFKQIPKIKAE